MVYLSYIHQTINLFSRLLYILHMLVLQWNYLYIFHNTYCALKIVWHTRIAVESLLNYVVLEGQFETAGTKRLHGGSCDPLQDQEVIAII